MPFDKQEVPGPDDSLTVTWSDDGEFELLLSSGSLYRAGQCPPPGLYRQVDGHRAVEIKGPGDRLPPSFDGHVACYRRIDRQWGQIAHEPTDPAAASA